jgi:hypothetical protein
LLDKRLLLQTGVLALRVGASALSKALSNIRRNRSMDPMYDIHYWIKQRREEEIREAQRRSLAKRGKGDSRTPFKLVGVDSALSGVLGLLR